MSIEVTDLVTENEIQRGQGHGLAHNAQEGFGYLAIQESLGFDGPRAADQWSAPLVHLVDKLTYRKRGVYERSGFG